jgi:hypothetical protein
MPAQAVVWRAVNTPLAQDVPGCGSTQFHAQHATIHAVVHLGDLRPGLVWMRHQFQLDDSGPLDVLIARFVGRYWLALEYNRAMDSGDDEISERL